MLGGVIPMVLVGRYSIGRMEWSSYVNIWICGVGLLWVGRFGRFWVWAPPAGGEIVVGVSGGVIGKGEGVLLVW